MTNITAQVLHENGFRSYHCDGEDFFVFEDLMFVNLPGANIWGWNRSNESFSSFEDLQTDYKRVKEKDFKPLPPVPISEQFLHLSLPEFDEVVRKMHGIIEKK